MDIVKPKSNTQIIEMLQNLLDQAKEGDIQGIAIAGATSSCATFNCFITGGNTMALVGEIHILARDVIDCEVDIRCSPNA